MNTTHAMTDEIKVDLQEGMTLRFTDSAQCAPHSLFLLTLWSSVFLGGKPVHCSGLLPGISLVIHAQPAGMDLEQKIAFVNQGWSRIQPQLDQWIEIAEQMPCVNLHLNDTTKVTCALDRQITLDKGVMQIVAAPN